MRDIKFRGVTPTGCWVKGSLIYHGEQPQIQYVTRRHPDDGRVLDTDWAYVDPKTVGQYTGLHDKNGKEIYEGDIIRMYSSNGNTYFDRLIIFRNGMFAGYFYDDDDKRWYFGESLKDLVVMSTYEVTVIGNIHDKPEMLTAKTM